MVIGKACFLYNIYSKLKKLDRINFHLEILQLMFCSGSTCYNHSRSENHLN